MIGAIIGDIAGSRFEFNNYRSKDFTLLHEKCYFTDDSVMTIALCEAFMRSADNQFRDLPEQSVICMREIGQPYPNCGYGGRFFHWMYADDPKPYNSYGNGAAMRVSGCAWVADSPEQAKAFSRDVTVVTHGHPEGLKGAEAVTMAIYLARIGKSITEIRDYIIKNYYAIDFTLDEIRESYQFNETCQNSVPQALEAFFESTDFEDAIRNAISIGGDSDTIAAITGSIAEAYYGVPVRLREKALTYLDGRLLKILNAFEARYPAKVS